MQFYLNHSFTYGQYNPFCPVAARDGRDILFRSYDAGAQTIGLYRWTPGGVAHIRDVPVMYNPLWIDGAYYYWWTDGIFRLDPETGESEQVYRNDHEMYFGMFWEDGGFIYAVDTGFSRSAGDYTVYRFDPAAGGMEEFPWLALSGYRSDSRETSLEFYGVAGNELLVYQPEGGRFFWLNIFTGETREDSLGYYPCGWRDGGIVLYRAGWDSMVLHDVQTGKETPLPLPEAVKADAEAFELLAVDGQAAYWKSGTSLYVQTGEAFAKVFSYSWETDILDAGAFYQLLDGVFYFAFFGTPDEGYDLTDLSIHDPALEEGEKMRFAALTPDGKVYILAEEYYNPYWQDF